MVNTNWELSEVGTIPSDWSVTTLHDPFVSLEAGVSVNSDEKADSSVYVLKSSVIYEGRFFPDQVKPVIPADCHRVKCPVVEGSIIISRMNTPLLVGECGFVNKAMPNCYLPDRLWQARNLKPAEYNFKWLNYLLSFGQYREAIRASGSGTSDSMKNISKENFLEIAIPKPSIEEQDAIAMALEEIDKLIEAVDGTIEKLSNLKAAYICELFPSGMSEYPIIRVDKHCNSWELKRIGDCLGERQERSSEGDLLSVTIADGIKLFSDLGRYDKSSADKSNYKKVLAGDIVYNTMRMWQGASGYSPYTGIVSPAYTVLYPKAEMDARFFSYAFKHPEMISMFQVFSQGMTTDTWNLKFPLLSEIEMMVPEIDEQKAIASRLEAID